MSNRSVSMQAGLSSDTDDSQEEVRTMMIRNIPNNCTQARFLREIHSKGFEFDYDFFYLPIDTETGANRGYAFINFTNSRAVCRFVSTFHGQKLTDFKSKKVLWVGIASLQGFEANFEHYSTKWVAIHGPCENKPIFKRSLQKEADCMQPATRPQRPEDALMYPTMYAPRPENPTSDAHPSAHFNSLNNLIQAGLGLELTTPLLISHEVQLNLRRNGYIVMKL
eukprot:TRINITY_DN111920_c0_g1_i1.p1 TRINITY_DN111920_c0_g1~~TRINITY_DN111920_c0_g1_i1.p1  ORF type:complete len:223 (-),score=17.51 TRINITY_DN111920_c0_g1_i1:27-695(-)